MAIRIPIKTEGGEQAANDLKKVGEEGQRALDRINNASKQPAAGLKALNAASNELRGGLSDMAYRAGPVGSVLVAMGPAGLAAAAGIGAFAMALTAATREADESERATRKIEGMLRITDSASGQTVASINALAESMSRSTLATADDVRAVSAQLLVYRNVSGETFGEVMRLAQDMASLGFGTLSSAAITLAKALENPGDAMKGLKQLGIELSDEQKNLIERMNETGDTAGAQEIILGTLRSKIAGAGQTDATGLTGAIHAAAEEWDNFLEGVGASGPLQAATIVVEGWALLFAKANSLLFKDTATQAAEKFAELQKEQAELVRRQEELAGARPGSRELAFNVEQQKLHVDSIKAEIKALTDKIQAEAQAAAAATQAAAAAKLVNEEAALQAQFTKEEIALLDEHGKAYAKDAAAAKSRAEQIAKTQAAGKQALVDQLAGLGEELYALSLNDKERAIFLELMKAEEIARKTGIELTTEMKAAIEGETGALYDRNKAVAEQKAADEKAATDRKRIAEKIIAENEKTVEKIDKTFHDGFVAMLEKGEGSWKSFTTSLKNTFKSTLVDELYKMFAQPFVVKVVASLVGAVSSGMANAAGQAVVNGAVGGSGGGAGGLLMNAGGSAAGSYATGGNSPLLSAAQSYGGYGGAYMGAAGGAYYGYQKGGVGGAVVGGVAGYAAGAAVTAGASALAAGWGVGASGGAAMAAGGQALSGVYSSLASMGPYGWIAMAVIAVAAYFGLQGAKPSDMTQQGTIDLGDGTKTNIGGMIGDKFSQQNADSVVSFLDAGTAFSKGIAEATGGEIAGQLSVVLGNREGYYFSLKEGVDMRNLQGRVNVASGWIKEGAEREDFFNLITTELIKSMTGITEEMRRSLLKIDFSNAEQSVGDLQFVVSAMKGTMFEVVEPVSQMKQAMDQLAIGFAAAKEQAARLGVAVHYIEEANAQALALLRKGFDDNIQLQILAITDPMAAELQAFATLAEARLQEAKDGGANLAAVEQLTALERDKIIQKYAAQSTNAMAGTAKSILDFVHQITGTTASPLATQTTLANAKDYYNTTLSAAQGGDTAAQAAITQAAKDYLDLEQQMYASSSQYFAVFDSVTASLTMLANSLNVTAGVTGPGGYTPAQQAALDGITAMITHTPPPTAAVSAPSVGIPQIPERRTALNARDAKAERDAARQAEIEASDQRREIGKELVRQTAELAAIKKSNAELRSALDKQQSSLDRSTSQVAAR